MLKFLKQDDRYTYIASGSLLGVTLKKTTSIPIGSIEIKRMFPLDFEEFLLANGFNRFAIDMMHEKFLAGESLDAAMHGKVIPLQEISVDRWAARCCKLLYCRHQYRKGQDDPSGYPRVLC